MKQCDAYSNLLKLNVEHLGMQQKIIIINIGSLSGQNIGLQTRNFQIVAGPICQILISTVCLEYITIQLT